MLLIPNGSPFHLNKEAVRFDISASADSRDRVADGLCQHGRRAGRTGVRRRSFVLDAQGELVAKMPQFEEATAFVEFENAVPLRGHGDENSSAATAAATPPPPRSFRSKHRFMRRSSWACATTSTRTAFRARSSACSGGVDSALVLAVAATRSAPDRVRAVMMPSRYTADISTTDAAEMARRVGVRYDEIAIAPMFDAFRSSLAQEFEGPPGRRHRGKHSGAYPRHPVDGAVEQVRLDRARPPATRARWRWVTARFTATWPAALR